MYMNKFITGAVVGSTIGVMGAMYALTSEKEKRKIMKRGKKFLNATSNKFDHLM